jgi:hypothetical protein
VGLRPDARSAYDRGYAAGRGALRKRRGTTAGRGGAKKTDGRRRVSFTGKAGGTSMMIVAEDPAELPSRVTMDPHVGEAEDRTRCGLSPKGSLVESVAPQLHCSEPRDRIDRVIGGQASSREGRGITLRHLAAPFIDGRERCLAAYREPCLVVVELDVDGKEPSQGEGIARIEGGEE